eukprot:5249766-Ditylum_brightwellii.AAC.1
MPKLRKITPQPTDDVARSLENRPKILGLRLNEVIKRVASDDRGIGWRQRMRHDVQNMCGVHGNGCNCNSMCLNPRDFVEIMYSIPAK